MKLRTLMPLSLFLVGFGFLEKSEKEEIHGSATFSVPKLFWPAFGLEYERKLVPRISAAGFLAAGRFDPLPLRFFLRGTEASPLTYDHWSIGARASWYAVGDFHHGMFVGGTTRYTRPSYTTTIDNDGTYNAYFHSVIAGAHLGYKIILSPGLTAQVHAGVGYNHMTEATLTENDLVKTDDMPTTVPPVASFGDLSVGWSF